MSSARRLALSRLASLTAGSAAYIALISAIYNETGSALWVSAALFFGVVGSVIGAPAAGWIGDRFERRRVMVGSDLAGPPSRSRARTRSSRGRRRSRTCLARSSADCSSGWARRRRSSWRWMP
ncbi:MAG: MFS transporter [Actinobacteria bacterium]|nr:MAG: MFS transporter [Actinomycetota bacterium]